jgi:hypothetical protein
MSSLGAKISVAQEDDVANNRMRRKAFISESIQFKHTAAWIMPAGVVHPAY